MLLSETTTTGFLELVPWIVFFPVIGLLLNIIFGRRWGELGVAITAVSASALSLVVSVLQFITLQGAHGEAMVYKLAEWLHIGSFSIPWEFRVDTLSVTMMLVVSGVGTLIHLYAVGYMHYDVRYKGDPKSYARFFIYLNLFIAMMMILVSGNSYLMLFVGWEGVGLCSFLLIGFWFTKNPDATEGTQNSYAAKKAFIANRVGDFGFLMAMFLTFWHFGTLSFSELFPEVAHYEGPESLVWWIAGFMLLGVTGKSAQIPLYVWLPDAMAGPTPVSALIHAATMVTAGVYLVARSAPVFSAVEGVHVMVALVGAATALFAATIAVGQYDIKKVLAYSTVSQLGFMVAAVGMGAYVAGMFHLVTHAFFKALLFLGSGSVILAVERGHHPLVETGDADASHGHDDHGHDDHHGEVFDPQDMRNMGGLRKKIPWTFWTYMAGTLALAGIFPFAGFWSKDEILLDASHFEGAMAVYWLLVIAAAFTAFYMGRQVWMVFFGEPRHHAAEEAKESPWTVLLPLVVLAILSTLGGFMNWPFESGLEPHRFGHWLEYTLKVSLGHELHIPEFSFSVAIQSTLIAVAAIFISWLVYGRKPLKSGQTDPLAKALGPIFKGMNAKWWVDELYQAVILTPYEKLAKFLSQTIDWSFWHDWFHEKGIRDNFQRLANFLANPIDMGVIDKISYLLAQGAQGSAGWLSKLQTGFVRNYALAVFTGVVVILGYLVLFR
ncbi:MAG TPA: NADH-quinone oxidoreductase subunit L [Anaerolineales bacterium]|jgi:NADH-quinone oxidoreductase subunit L|nr:NADH-quinone oxidoreductase subunit L [Anaerolineales bacterium]